MKYSKQTIWGLSVLFILTACNGINVSERLDLVDSLIVKEQYDSATVILNSIGGDSCSPENQAHYYLLATQLGYPLIILCRQIRCLM